MLQALVELKIVQTTSILFHAFGGVWIQRDYLAGAGRFLDCFHPTAILKIE